ncbi:AAA family ATPase, partial [Frankia sp. AvcI1]|uniref:AAA family ATPase n=1 Tax=Frankia sp. AvcI1 TaxID=573496 RepID=UPI002118CE98
MTVPTDPAGGGGSPRSAERLSSAFRYTGDPLFVLHGPGVLDALVCRDYLERDFEAALWEELSAAGFERIVFWTPWEKGLYFRDADSSAGRPRGTGSPLGTGSPRGIGASETANAAGPVPPPAAPGGPAGGTMRFFNGPMGAVNRLGAGRLGPGRPSGPGGPGAGAAVGTGRPPAASTVGSMTDGAAVRLLATWLSPRGPRNPLRTAAVFLSTPELLTHLRPEAVRPLAGLFGELTGGPRTDHLCVLISGESDRSRIIAEVRRTGLFTTLADWLEGTAADGCYGYVGHAPPAEIERAIHRTRLVDGLDIGDWAGLPRLAAAMSAESNATRKWLSTMQLWARERRPLDGPELAKAGHLTGGSPDGRSAWERLDAMTGLGTVKEHVRRLAGATRLLAARPAGSGRRAQAGSHHLVFTGGPGTGKTTVARLIGEIYRDLGILARGHVRAPEVSQLVAGYEGQTAIAVNREADEALDGVLFIDEAYRLTERRDSPFGQEAVNALLSRMENDRERLVVIVAGYQGEMKRFLDANPGLRGRFPEANIIHFPDYEPDELTDILLRNLADIGLTWEPDTEEALRTVVAGIHRLRDERFSNAREMRSLADDLQANWSSRVQRAAGAVDLGKRPAGDDGRAAAWAAEQETAAPGDLAALWERPLLRADIPGRYAMHLPGQAPPIDEVLAGLAELIGLGQVKAHIRELAGTMQLLAARPAGSGRRAPAGSHHLVFTGGPGTGKTTVARLIGEIYRAIGVLRRGHVRAPEVSQLVAGYEGQTAIAVNREADEALDGVLFIDEAYRLTERRDSPFGQEAVNALLSRMENDRERLVVIVAGYQEHMRRFLDANPGLRGRFPEANIIPFPDYEPD